MQVNKPRKPIVALLMSLVLPGFGQLYNGEINKALWLFIAFAFISVPALAMLATYLPGLLMVLTLFLTQAAAIALWIYGMVDAWRRARSKPDYVPEPWQRSGMYALVLILGNVFILPVMTTYVRAHYFESFRIPSVSMEPSVLRGDFITADKRYNCHGCKNRIERGDIAIFTYPNDRATWNIKRIVALPGDRVQIHGHIVEINGQSLAPPATDAHATDITEKSPAGREWRVHWDPNLPSRGDVDLVVPPGKVFVLGDNRSNSRDSRNFGTVSMQDVVGRARQVWFSYGPHGIRWSRLGARLQ